MSTQHVAECFGVKVPQSAYLNPKRIERIDAARYEGQEIAGALCVVEKGDRVLELGAGLGIVGAVVAKNAAPEKVLSFEANENLIEPIRSLYDLNRLGNRIEIRNQVLLATPDIPETLPFFVRNSFLGSSLIESNQRATRRVDVPTASYAELHADFAPDVLLVDIEGGELDFLRNAKLDGVRGIVIEFHPEAYGREGMRECKSILRRAGFTKLAEHSSKHVWTCTRDFALEAPQPKGGWSTKVTALEGALIVPPTESGMVRATGILSASGTYCAEGALWRHNRVLTTEPSLPNCEPSERSGTWLWGGTLWMHFGHFLVESLSRLWALDHVSEPIDGVLFAPKRPGRGGKVAPFHTAMFEALEISQPVACVSKVERVERLIVPGQGFGLGNLIVGTDHFRRFAKDRFGRVEPTGGAEKIYVSRSLLPARLGGLVNEKALEDRLRDKGYSIYHPEKHDISHQIATYKAARKVIAAEGSALHLLAFCASAETEIALVVRRYSGATRNIAKHLEVFTGRKPHLVSHIRQVWKPIGHSKPRNMKAELDLPGIKASLAGAGFVSGAGPDWLTEDANSARNTMVGYGIVNG